MVVQTTYKVNEELLVTEGPHKGRIGKFQKDYWDNGLQCELMMKNNSVISIHNEDVISRAEIDAAVEAAKNAIREARIKSDEWTAGLRKG